MKLCSFILIHEGHSCPMFHISPMSTVFFSLLGHRSRSILNVIQICIVSIKIEIHIKKQRAKLQNIATKLNIKLQNESKAWFVFILPSNISGSHFESYFAEASE